LDDDVEDVDDVDGTTCSIRTPQRSSPGTKPSRTMVGASVHRARDTTSAGDRYALRPVKVWGGKRSHGNSVSGRQWGRSPSTPESDAAAPSSVAAASNVVRLAGPRLNTTRPS